MQDIKDTSYYLSKLCSSTFKNCNLEKVIFTKADLSYVDFTNATLCDMNFNWVQHNDISYNTKLWQIIKG